MAPIIKTTLTLLSVSASVISVVNAQHNNNIANAAQHHGKHLKLAKRTLFEDLGKREHEFAPYGYDRCVYHSPYLLYCLTRTDLVHFLHPLVPGMHFFRGIPHIPLWRTTFNARFVYGHVMHLPSLCPLLRMMRLFHLLPLSPVPCSLCPLARSLPLSPITPLLILPPSTCKPCSSANLQAAYQERSPTSAKQEPHLLHRTSTRPAQPINQ